MAELNSLDELRALQKNNNLNSIQELEAARPSQNNNPSILEKVFPGLSQPGFHNLQREDVENALGSVGIGPVSGAAKFIPELIGKAKEPIKSIPGMAKGTFKSLTGQAVKNTEKSLGEHSKAIVEDIYGIPYDYLKKEKLFGKTYKLNAHDLKQNYLKNLEESSGHYSSAMGEGSSSKLDKNHFKDVLKSVRDIRGYEGSPLKGTLAKFLDNQNYKSLHELKSAVGSRLSELKAPYKAERNQDAVEKMKGAYDSLENLLFDKFGTKYRQANQFWKENVLPYRQNPVIRRSVIENKPQASLPKVLTRGISAISEGIENPV